MWYFTCVHTDRIFQYSWGKSGILPVFIPIRIFQCSWGKCGTLLVFTPIRIFQCSCGKCGSLPVFTCTPIRIFQSSYGNCGSLPVFTPIRIFQCSCGKCGTLALQTVFMISSDIRATSAACLSLFCTGRPDATIYASPKDKILLKIKPQLFVMI